MIINVIQNVEYEGPGLIRDWAMINGHQLNIIKAYKDDLSNLDVNRPLIVLGGPMSVYNKTDAPFLTNVEASIKKVMSQNEPVLGICLGAQLIASTLGMKVYPATIKEIGWYPVELTETGKAIPSIRSAFKDSTTVFHWHGDTFDLPLEAKHIFRTPDCVNQGFLFSENVIGLQFHLEVSWKEASLMALHGRTELQIGGMKVQGIEAIKKGAFEYNTLSELNRLLGYWLNN